MGDIIVKNGRNTMYLTKKDIIIIKDFFEDREISDAFIELFKFVESSVCDIEYEIRDNLIGVKREGEKLRFYVSKSQNGDWYFSVKNKKREKFNIDNILHYKNQIEYANEYFANNPNLVRLKNTNDSTFEVERAINPKTGVNSIIIKNLNLNVVSLEDSYEI